LFLFQLVRACTPMTHALQSSPFRPTFPALHWQEILSILPGSWVHEFEGHVAQVETVVAATVDENVP